MLRGRRASAQEWAQGCTPLHACTIAGWHYCASLLRGKTRSWEGAEGCLRLHAHT